MGPSGFPTGLHRITRAITAASLAQHHTDVHGPCAHGMDPTERLEKIKNRTDDTVNKGMHWLGSSERTRRGALSTSGQSSIQMFAPGRVCKNR